MSWSLQISNGDWLVKRGSKMLPILRATETATKPNFTVDNFSPTTVTEYSILMGGKERNNNQKCQIAAI